MIKLFFPIASIVLMLLLATTLKVENHELPSYIPKNQNDTLEYINSSVKTPQIAKYFKNLCTKNKFNGNILVAEKGQILYEFGSGFSDHDKKDSLKIESRFQIASISKQFTAVSVMILYDRKLLDFDDLVTNYYPDFPYKKVTIRMLLCHRSGVPNYEGLGIHPYSNGFTLNNQKMMELYALQKIRPNFPANQRFKYSNSGYAVLAAIVEKVSGVGFTNFVQTNIFDPLNMKDSYFLNWSDTTTRKNVTIGYLTGWTPAIPTYLDGVMGDKGIYSTLHDLLKWDQGLYTDNIVKQSTLELAFKGENPGMYGNRNYGFGWRTRILQDGTKMAYHGGWWRGYRALFARILPNQGTIIILGNQHNGSFANNYNLILDILNPKFMHGGKSKQENESEDDLLGSPEANLTSKDSIR